MCPVKYIGAQWYGGAEFVSRAPITGLGADGNGSQYTFLVGNLLADVYDWRDEAGKTLMNSGFDNFQSLYNQTVNEPVAWDINQLRSEQAILQPIHEKYLSDANLFTGLSQWLTNTDYSPILDQQGMSGGIDILDESSRIRFGCKLMGYSAEQGCSP